MIAINLRPKKRRRKTGFENLCGAGELKKETKISKTKILTPGENSRDF